MCMDGLKNNCMGMKLTNTNNMKSMLLLKVLSYVISP